MLGPCVDGNSEAQIDAASNRELLVEICRSMSVVLANAFHERPVRQQVTCCRMSARPLDKITANKFAELDRILVHESWLGVIRDVRSRRDISVT